jgi:hypothetical protein
MDLTGPGEGAARPESFFISYNKADEAWALWCRWALLGAGYGAMCQATDIRPGHDFVAMMHLALNTNDRLLLVLSPDSLASDFVAAEWGAAFADDPAGRKRKLVGVRVRDCQPGGLLKTRVHIDLVGLADEEAALSRFLDGLLEKPTSANARPRFPNSVAKGGGAVARADGPAFPGGGPRPDAGDGGAKADGCVPNSAAAAKGRAYAKAVADGIAGILEPATAVITHFYAGLDLSVERLQPRVLAEAIAALLVAMTPARTFQVLREARERFEDPGREDPQALNAIRKVVRRVVLLIYDEADLTSLRNAGAAGGGLMLSIPAANETFAEILMARFDDRPPAARNMGPAEWPVGQNAIPLPAEMGPGYLGRFAEVFERHVFEQALGQRDRRLTSETDKRSIANGNIRMRNKRTNGSLYCIVDVPIDEADRPYFEARLTALVKDWPSIHFVRLDDAFERRSRENALLWALKDMLHDG